MQLIVISDESWLPGEVAAVELLLAKNSNIRFHLRKPGASLDEVQRFVEQLSPVALSQTVLHQFFPLLSLFSFAGIHRNSHNAEEFHTASQYALTKSFAAHSFEDIRSNTGFDYYLLSPIFDSISKSGYVSRFDNESLTSFLHEYSQIPVIALGGISIDNIDVCREMGFAGVAVLGSVWNAYRHGGLSELESVMDDLMLKVQ